MRTLRREINIFSMSALDLFASALGAFILITVMLFPFFPNTGDSPERAAAVRAQLKQTQRERDEAIDEQRAALEDLRKRRQELADMAGDHEQTREELERTRSELAKVRFPHLDLVIALDTTGSMQGTIGSLKDELANLVDLLSRLAPSLGVGVVAFNDRRQIPTLQVHGLNEVEPGSHSFAALREFIGSLRAGAARGPNHEQEEAMDQAVERAIAASWRANAEKRIIIVISDAPPYADRTDAIRAMVARFRDDPRQSVSGIWIDSHDTGFNAAAAFLKELSRRGKGNYVESGHSITSSILLAVIG